MVWILKDVRELYCSEDDVIRVNEALKDRGNVFFVLDTEKSFRGLSLVVPKWRSVANESDYHYALNKKNEKHEQNENSLCMWADCGRTSAAVVGSPSSASSDVVVLDNSAIIERNSEIENIESLNEAQQLATSMFHYCKDNLATLSQNIDVKKAQKKMKVQSKPKEGNFLSGILAFDRSMLQPQETIVKSHPQVELSPKMKASIHKNTIQEYWRQFAAVFLNDQECPLFQELGINQYVKPNIGDSLVVMPAMLAPQWQRLVPPPALYSPNFHWAPVCFVSINGDEYKYITLESFSTLHKGGTAEDSNEFWEFREYIACSDRSYHSCAHESEGYGNVTLTLRVRVK